jgi:prepilin-type N-terminal cleavage/methylation domain-containing protein
MKGQKGMTLVELLMAIAVTGLIVVFLGTAVYQIITVSEYGNDRLTALHELQNSAYWFNLDGQKAVNASADGGLLLTISETSSITYALVGTELRRTATGSEMTLARNIASAAFSIDNRVITMSLTSSPEGRDNVSESATYKVCLRPAEEG